MDRLFSWAVELISSLVGVVLSSGEVEQMKVEKEHDTTEYELAH